MSVTFEQAIDFVKSKAPQVAQREEHSPIVHLVKDGNLSIILLTGRANISDQLRLLLAKTQPDAYVLIVEARFKAGVERLDYVGQIADDPANPEMLAIIAAPRGGPVKHFKANIWPTRSRAALRRGDWREVGVWQDVSAETQGVLVAMGPIFIENW